MKKLKNVEGGRPARQPNPGEAGARDTAVCNSMSTSPNWAELIFYPPHQNEEFTNPIMPCHAQIMSETGHF